MTKKIQSNIDYEQVCKELGITMDTLMSLSSFDTNTKSLSKVSFIKAANDFIENLEMLVKINKRSETTLTTYSNFITRIKKFIKNEIDPNLPLVHFNEVILHRFFSTLKPRNSKVILSNEEEKFDMKEEEKKKDISNYTTNKYIAIIRRLYKFAYIVEYVDRDLSFRFEPNRVGLFPRYFDDEQVKSILKYSYKRTYGYRWHTMVCFMLATGCRINETTNIKIKDINFKDDIIFVKGKGDKERVIPIYPEIKKKLINYLHKTGVTIIGDCNGYLFSRDENNIRKKMISNRVLQYQVSNILKDAKINESHFTTHSFRHTFAVNCLKAGMKIHILSQVLGHRNPATTSIYTQLLPVDLRDEVMKKYPFPIEELLKEIM
ncbi:site-specific integrase [Bacillus sp. EB106-08-02-XG196]|uniref:tyrosine-type recombinase/integrase n=1 Tax=Bacillus sp. EB106-08-02-XG196 TaxID=2737049 RepID=UPI0015C482D1|nr:site-specific integrase [Bacillus sp. EB106-08-02-XG196]NWQ40350.1 site-specific integrase [Bacillus sp. EB106-08-02-XG196]